MYFLAVDGKIVFEGTSTECEAERDRRAPDVWDIRHETVRGEFSV